MNSVKSEYPVEKEMRPHTNEAPKQTTETMKFSSNMVLKKRLTKEAITARMPKASAVFRNEHTPDQSPFTTGRPGVGILVGTVGTIAGFAVGVAVFTKKVGAKVVTGLGSHISPCCLPHS